MTRPPIVVLGSASGPRADAFRAALTRLGETDAVYFSYAQFLAAPGTFAAAVRPGTILRFDSPDRERDSLKALYQLGAASTARAGYTVYEGVALDELLDSRGAIGSPAQLGFGLNAALTKAATLAAKRGARLLADPAELITTFDKTATTAHLEAHGVTVPRAIGPVSGFDDLMEKMNAAHLSRVFVKLRFGSSAAGMTALALGPGGQIVAYTTAIHGSRGLMHATRDVRRLVHHHDVREVVDGLSPLGLHAEAWLPKANIKGRSADLRVVLVAGEPVFGVMRLSPHPMTNLHLGGARRPADTLRRRAGEAAWSAMLESCRAAGKAFPSCFMLGVDAAILADGRRHALFEVNAFGDHVKGATYRGCTPQEWQVLRYRMHKAA